MGQGTTYGINFPFRDSFEGTYFDLSNTSDEEIRSNLIHLLLTRKGTRYFLPDFGTRLYEFIFEPFDTLTFDAIQSDIRDAVQTYMPGLLLNNITITPMDPREELYAETEVNVAGPDVASIYRFPGKGTSEYTAQVRIDYSSDRSTFGPSDFVIINI